MYSTSTPRAAASARALEEERVGVKPGHARPAGGEPVRDAAVPAGHVEHLDAALEPEQAPQAIRLRV
jgi:hypothetical protein